jgi:TPR repeat protein
MDRERKVKHLLRNLALIVASVSCMSIADGSNDGGALDFQHIRAADIPGLEHQALLGDGNAALRLADYYDYLQLDYSKAMYWMQIAAEDGSPTGQYNYAHMLDDDSRAGAMGQTDAKSRELAKLRARYWFNEAAKHGGGPKLPK